MSPLAANLGAVVAGIQISKEWDRMESPWYNLFNEIPLEPFTDARARELLMEHAEVTEELERKIARAREVDEWRRGAIPRGKRLDETVAPVHAPDSYILIAADGSQIYPDRHAAAAYFLLNTGTIVFRCGTGQAPAVSSTVPMLAARPMHTVETFGRMRFMVS